MFKNLIYFDSQKVVDYSALLKGERQVDFKKYKKNTSKTFKGGAYIASENYDNIDEFEGGIVDNPIFDCNEFEELLEKK